MTTEDTATPGRADVVELPERPNQPVATIATIPPDVWTAVCVDTDGRTIDAYNPGTEDIELVFTDDPDSTGRVAPSALYPIAGWRARHRAYNPATDAELPGAEHGERRWEAEREAREAAAQREHDQRTALHLAAGNIELTGQDPDGTRRYRITEAGARHIEQQLGLPPNTVPFGTPLLER